MQERHFLLITRVGPMGNDMTMVDNIRNRYNSEKTSIINNESTDNIILL